MSITIITIKKEWISIFNYFFYSFNLALKLKLKKTNLIRTWYSKKCNKANKEKLFLKFFQIIK